jgi:hypothetical protein
MGLPSIDGPAPAITHSRRPGVTLEEAQLVFAALAGLRQADRRMCALALVVVFSARSRPYLERPLSRLLKNGLSKFLGATGSPQD